MSNRIVFCGKDHTEGEKHGFVIFGPTAAEEAKEEEDSSTEADNLLAEDYFRSFSSFPLRGLSPFNLGVYKKGEEGLYASQYIGVVPLLSLKEGKDLKGKEPSIIRVSSRFGISATKMLETVLKGDDFYNNPKMLTSRSYTSAEWKKLAEKFADDDGPVFGVISGIGEIELSSTTEGDDTDQSDLGMSEEAEGIFEIIDFINKAKSLCKKSLKRQSERKEENLACKVKGRILVQKQIRENEMRGRKQMVYCAYNTMSANIKENQIIKCALHLCQMKREISDSLAEDIRFCMNALKGVPLKRCSHLDFMGLKNNGAYKEYKDVLNAAKKVMSRYKIAYDNSSGNNSSEGKLTAVDNHKTQPHFIDMNKLFEYYCRALFQEAINKLNTGKDAELLLELEPSVESWRDLISKDAEMEVFMKEYKPDIVVKYGAGNPKSGIACVIDAKYSPLEKQNLARRERTHQVLFYMEALGCSRGGLIGPSEHITEEKADIIDESKFKMESILVNGSKIDKGPSLCYLPLEYEKGKIIDSEGHSAHLNVIKGYLKSVCEEICKDIKEQNRIEKEDEIR